MDDPTETKDNQSDVCDRSNAENIKEPDGASVIY